MKSSNDSTPQFSFHRSCTPPQTPPLSLLVQAPTLFPVRALQPSHNPHMSTCTLALCPPQLLSSPSPTPSYHLFRHGLAAHAHMQGPLPKPLALASLALRLKPRSSTLALLVVTSLLSILVVTSLLDRYSCHELGLSTLALLVVTSLLVPPSAQSPVLQPAAHACCNLCCN